MKVVLVLIVVAVLYWMLRGGARPGSRPPSANSEGAPLPMLKCAQCGLHLPKDETLPGRGGVFCSAAHRAVFEQAHPPPA